jgi:ubiquitin-conjugating enzyme E2 Q
MPLPQYATSNTTKRLMKDLQTCKKVQDKEPSAELGWYIDVEKIENVYQWIVELHSFHTFEIKGKKLPLAEDMEKKGVKSVVIEIRFNKDFPFTPPYVRVIRPRFLGFNQGGGGHIVLGGAMCMELLTNTGWSSVSSMDSVLLQIRTAIASEPFARLDMHNRGGDYGTGEAAEGYIRACAAHGWQVPPGFKEMAYGGAGPSF